MGVVHNPASPLGIELEKWEQHQTKYVRELDEDGNPGKPGNPYRFRPYPMMLYRAQVWPASGKAMCMGPLPDPYAFDTNRSDLFQRGQLEAERFTNQCQIIAKDDEHERRLKNDGWRNSPDEALAQFERMMIERSNATAERHAAEQRMSARARAESALVDNTTSEHVPDPSKAEIAEAVKDKKRSER